MNLRKAGQTGVRCPQPPKPKILYVWSPVLKVGECRKLLILPDEGPPDLGRCPRKEKDGLSPKRGSDADVKDWGSADEAVVAVKLPANDKVGTSLRVKLVVSDRSRRRRVEHVNVERNH